MKTHLFPALVLSLCFAGVGQAKPWVVYHGTQGPGLGKRIVFVSGDEEYRSEEALPMLARILAQRHGFTCTVLFAINPKDGTIDPNYLHNIPGLAALDNADMMVLFTRFRGLPDNQMKHIVDFVNSGKPILGLRTATHAFQWRSQDPPTSYPQYDWRSKKWLGGFGRHVLGETWVSHHGSHGHESTRGILNPQFTDHPILRGVRDIWGPTDVYTVIHLPPDAKVLVYGEVLKNMKPTDPPVPGPKNHPMMPLVWIRHYTGSSGKSARIIGTTMGASVDLKNPGLRRLLVNACYWGLGMEDQIAAESDVRYVGAYKPTFFGFGKSKRGVKPEDLAWPPRR